MHIFVFAYMVACVYSTSVYRKFIEFEKLGSKPKSLNTVCLKFQLKLPWNSI